MTMDSQVHYRRYADRIGRVRDHIYTHLDEELDLDRLADVACLSRFHWHRVYTAMTGETVAQTVRRLRLARAADELANTTITVEEIAKRAGYSSQSAFGRAFAVSHGKPPAEFRANGEHATLVRALTAGDASALPIAIRDLPERRALALVHEGPYPEIGRTFGQLFSVLQTEGLAAQVTGMAGAYVADPDGVAPEALRSHACVLIEAEAAPEAALIVAVGGGPYAILTYQGPYAAMRPAYNWLFGTWLPASGRVARDRPVLEFYLNSPADTAPQELLTEICLPLEDAS